METAAHDAALQIAIAVPEARVLGLAQAHSGDIAPSAADRLAEAIAETHAALRRPGMLDIATVQDLLRRVLPRVVGTPLVLDAGALAALSAQREAVRHLAGQVVLTSEARLTRFERATSCSGGMRSIH